MVTARALRSRVYRTSSPLSIRTEDGLLLTGSRVGGGGPAIVLSHGFLGWHRKGRIVRFVERLADRFRIYAIDLRGHGESEGVSTFGAWEFLDVDAAVSLARAETGGPVVTVGMSMGGIAVLRQAAFRGGVDAVVSVSTPARWLGHPSLSARQIRWITSSPRGRRLALAMGTRITQGWEPPEEPEDVVARIAPTPLIVVHGRDDHVIGEEEAWRLYRRAGEPKRLMLASPFGHAEDGLSSSFAHRLTRRIEAALG